MSLVLFSGNTTVQNFYPGLIARMLKEADLLPYIHVEGGAITGTYNIPTAYNTTSSIQDYQSTPSSPQGGQTFKDRKITLGKWMLYQEFLPNDLKQYWAPFAPTGAFEFQTLPADVQTTMLQLIFNESGSHMSNSGWNGDTTRNDELKYFNGFVKLATSDPEIFKVTGTTTLSKTNILSEMDRALTQSRAAKDSFRIASYKPDFKIFVSYKTFEIYGAALKALTTKSISYENATPNQFAGIKLVPQAYVPNDRIIFANGSNALSSNMWMAVNSIQDAETLKVDKLQANSEKYFAKLILSGGVAFVKPEEVSIY